MNLKPATWVVAVLCGLAILVGLAVYRRSRAYEAGSMNAEGAPPQQATPSPPAIPDSAATPASSEGAAAKEEAGKEDPARAAEWRTREYAFESTQPSKTYLDSQVDYYAGYLNMTSDQRKWVDVFVRRWWEDHWELQYLVVSDRSDKETWKRRRDAMRETHRHRWDAFKRQISAYLSEDQVERLAGNYPGQFPFKYDAGSPEAEE